MKLPTPAGQQIAVDRLADKRVPERVGPGTWDLDEHLVGERVAQTGLELVVGEVNDRAQQALIDGTAGGRRDLKQPPSRIRKPLDPQQQQVSQRCGKRGGFSRRQQFLRVERIALAALE